MLSVFMNVKRLVLSVVCCLECIVLDERKWVGL